MKRVNAIARVLLAASQVILPLTGCLIGGVLAPRVHAQSGSKATTPGPKRLGSKISVDLQKEIGSSPNAFESVIIQTESVPSIGFLSSVRAVGGLVNKGYLNLNTTAVRLPLRAVNAVASRPDVRYLSPDRPAEVAGHVEITTGADQARSYGTFSTGAIDGSGTTIAVLDSGIFSAHHSFRSSTLQSRVIASIDFTDEAGVTGDPNGHGTHVASLAAGNGQIANGWYTGIAPAAKIINVRVLDSQGQGSSSSVIAGIDWCISNKDRYGIRVMNLSLGTCAVDSYVYDPICQAVRRAFNAGIVVCVAAGNLGKGPDGGEVYGSIHSPGIEPSAITVGAVNSKGSNSRGDDTLATYSSRGPTRGYYTDTNGVRHYDNLVKPDLVAPGNKLIGARSPNNRLATENPQLIVNVSSDPNRAMMRLSGTSMATPLVAGAAALLIQRNPALTASLVKAILEYSAQPIPGYDNFEQGAGLLNVEGAVRLAANIRQDLSGLGVGAHLLVSLPPTQMTAIWGQTFSWAGGILQKWNAISGTRLITQYQGIYGEGVLLTDGTIFGNGVLLVDGSLISDGLTLSDGVMLSDGTVLASGSILADGAMLADGTLMSDGVLISDGVLMSDSVLSGTTAALDALSVPTNGDLGDAMEIVSDGT